MNLDPKPTGLELLRKPCPPNQISKLPQPTANKAVMDTLPKASCKECGGYHATSKIIHLDYVGHAALTDRLLDADPQWAWVPAALEPNGMPALDPVGGLWIKLTVCGVTRYGYGHAGDKTGGNAIKELIGDALRNAAMRFGAALDLWHKGDLHVEEEAPKPSPASAQSGTELIKATFAGLQPEVQDALRHRAPQIDAAAMTDAKKAKGMVEQLCEEWHEDIRNDVKMGLWWLLDTKTKSAIRKVA